MTTIVEKNRCRGPALDSNSVNSASWQLACEG